MLTDRHKEIGGKIWEIANRLRGPYRPPQYRLVMLPMVVLRRLDCVLEPTKDAVLAEHARLVAASARKTPFPACLTRVVGQGRKQPLYNISPYTFQKLLGDSENIAPNLVAFINGFSDTARRIFEKFKFGDQIEKLDSSNRLYRDRPGDGRRSTCTRTGSATSRWATSSSTSSCASTSRRMRRQAITSPRAR